jgi:antitoxin YefM
MKIISYTDARNGLKAVLDGVVNDADIAVITRREGGNAVLMSQAQYESMAETLYLLSNPANASHLAASIAQHKAGKAKRRELVAA